MHPVRSHRCPGALHSRLSPLLRTAGSRDLRYPDAGGCGDFAQARCGRRRGAGTRREAVPERGDRGDAEPYTEAARAGAGAGEAPEALVLPTPATQAIVFQLKASRLPTDEHLKAGPYIRQCSYGNSVSWTFTMPQPVFQILFGIQMVSETIFPAFKKAGYGRDPKIGGKNWRE